MLLRPVQDSDDDAEAVRLLAGGATGPGSGPSPGETPQSGWLPAPRAGAPGPAACRELIRHLARTDPGGSWLAVGACGQPAGAVQSFVREGTWGLALLAVRPGARRAGIGTALLERAAAHGRGCLRGMACCPEDPAAARALRKAGLALHPAMRLRGIVRPERLADPDGPVVAGPAGQRDLLDSVDRRLRGGAHGPDHDHLMRHCRLLVADDLAGSGYCYLRGDGRLELLAATSRRLATRLLTAALHGLAGRAASIPHLTAEQQWALDVGLAAGLGPENAGYVCLRGMRAPAPYVPSAALL